MKIGEGFSLAVLHSDSLSYFFFFNLRRARAIRAGFVFGGRVPSVGLVVTAKETRYEEERRERRFGGTKLDPRAVRRLRERRACQLPGR